eukprot:TRINITY_DN82152_c0_g1_i1.p1 TRINITY_DN82152_c0_g1~~TRINITY_DN82152_c0_g1_i1.p1  ORF type:complete len:479 (+),score=69.29 TRINITY_DN82152_c0_g1_i1:32-1438(+)
MSRCPLISLVVLLLGCVANAEKSDRESEDEAAREVPLVTLVIRAYFGAFSMLMPMIRSVEIFWPYWKWPVVLVLDADSAADVWMGTSMFPKWMQVFLEEKPPHMDQWAELRRHSSVSKLHGYQRQSFSNFFLDKYVASDFIAQIDSDTVFHTWVTEDMLFDERKRPHVMGITQWSDFGHVLRVLGLQTDIDFMASQPMVIARKHFAAVRNFVTKTTKARDFSEAFLHLTHAVLVNETKLDHASDIHLACWQAVAGSYLWQNFNDMYAWHINWQHEGAFESGKRHWRAGAPLAKMPADHFRCPMLNVATHLSCWGDEKGRCVNLKQPTAPEKGGAQGEKHYLAKAVELLTLGLCEAHDLLLKSWLQQGKTEPEIQVIDRLFGVSFNSKNGQFGNPTDETLPTPANVCADIRSRFSMANLLFGVANTIFWLDEARGLPKTCINQGVLVWKFMVHHQREAERYFERLQNGG